MDTTQLLERLKQAALGAKSSETPLERLERRVAEYNGSTGDLNLADGYDCPKCQNRGLFAFAEEANGYLYERYRVCECRKARDSIARIARSGLQEALSRLTFDSYVVRESWQDQAKKRALSYAKDSPDSAWLLVCGQVGSGKTHLCTAVCGEFLRNGHEVVYSLWRNDMAALKRAQREDSEPIDIFDRLTGCEILYLDDLFKPAKGEGVSASDIKLTYDIINSRYISRRRTIISGELLIGEMLSLDEATASRICELSKGFRVQISRQDGRNYRIRE